MQNLTNFLGHPEVLTKYAGLETTYWGSYNLLHRFVYKQVFYIICHRGQRHTAGGQRPIRVGYILSELAILSVRPHVSPSVLPSVRPSFHPSVRSSIRSLLFGPRREKGVGVDRARIVGQPKRQGRPLQLWVRQKLSPKNILSKILHDTLKFQHICSTRQFKRFLWLPKRFSSNCVSFDCMILYCSFFSPLFLLFFMTKQSDTIYSLTPTPLDLCPSHPPESRTLGNIMKITKVWPEKLLSNFFCYLVFNNNYFYSP